MSAVACPCNQSVYGTEVTNTSHSVFTPKCVPQSRRGHVSPFHFNDTVIAAIQVHPSTTDTATEDLWLALDKILTRALSSITSTLYILNPCN